MDSKTLTAEPEAWRNPVEAGEAFRWRMGLRHVLYLIFYLSLVFWMMRELALAGILVVLFLNVVAAVAAAFVLIRRRAAQQDALLAVIAAAAQQGMPLPPAVEAVSDQFTGRYRHMVRALAYELNAGCSLPEALDRVPGTLPAETELLALVGSEAGTLAGALRDAGSHRNGFKPAWRGIAQRIGYFVGVLIVMQVITWFLFYHTIPRIQAILRDFRVGMPPVTQFVIEVGDHVRQWWPLLGLLIVVENLALLALLASQTDWLRLGLPGADRLMIRRHSALILRGLALAVEGGDPITRGLGLLRHRYPTAWIRKRLSRVTQDVQHGSDWTDSLVHHGLLRRADAAVLESAMRVGNLPWALRETALSGERRLASRLQIALNLVTLAALIALGVLVALYCVAFFAPVVKLLEVLV